MASITDNGRGKIIKGETMLADMPNSHNAHGYLPCRLKIVCTYVGPGGTSLKLQALDHESGDVLVEIGTFHLPEGGSLQFDVQGEPIMAIAYPYRVD